MLRPEWRGCASTEATLVHEARGAGEQDLPFLLRVMSAAAMGCSAGEVAEIEVVTVCRRTALAARVRADRALCVPGGGSAGSRCAMRDARCAMRDALRFAGTALEDCILT